MTKNRLYLLLAGATIAGYGYLAWAIKQHGENDGFTACLFKNATGLPCPSCGSTRSVLSLVKGNINEALFTNPLGVIIALIMGILPLWILYDFILKKDTLYRFYFKFEKVLQTKWIAIVLILLVIANWVWNINKLL